MFRILAFVISFFLSTSVYAQTNLADFIVGKYWSVRVRELQAIDKRPILVTPYDSLRDVFKANFRNGSLHFSTNKTLIFQKQGCALGNTSNKYRWELKDSIAYVYTLQGAPSYSIDFLRVGKGRMKLQFDFTYSDKGINRIVNKKWIAGYFGRDSGRSMQYRLDDGQYPVPRIEMTLEEGGTCRIFEREPCSGMLYNWLTWDMKEDVVTIYDNDSLFMKFKIVDVLDHKLKVIQQ